MPPVSDILRLPNDLQQPYAKLGAPSGVPLHLLHGFAVDDPQRTLGTIIYPGTGHGLTLEAPRRLASDLASFSQEVVDGV